MGFAKKKICSQSGFTLVEMVATVALLSLLLAMAVGALSNYFSHKSLETSARELTSQIREAQAMAVASGSTYRIDFTSTDGNTYMLQRWQGTSFVDVRGPITLESSVRFAEGSTASLEFYARGTSQTGQLIITERFGKVRTVDIEGETVNVTIS